MLAPDAVCTNTLQLNDALEDFEIVAGAGGEQAAFAGKASDLGADARVGRTRRLIEDLVEALNADSSTICFGADVAELALDVAQSLGAAGVDAELQGRVSSEERSSRTLARAFSSCCVLAVNTSSAWPSSATAQNPPVD